MGGSYYDRDVGSSSSGSYSAASNAILSANKGLHSSCNPNRWSETKLVSDHKNPIIFALDVTGSMGDWSKIIYDKLPMFYGQIMMQGYLDEPAISFCAIGDATCDEAPLQVTEFGQGSQIDQLISKIFLEGGGGGSYFESYELAGYFYNNHCQTPNAELPFLFITGDESYYPKISKKHLNKLMPGFKEAKDVNTKELFAELMTKYNVFLLKKPYGGGQESKILQDWIELIGKERILMLHESKACIDIALGAIALTSRRRTLAQYEGDMRDRGQSEERIEEVKKALKVLNDSLNIMTTVSKNATSVSSSSDENVSTSAIEMARQQMAAYLAAVRSRESGGFAPVNTGIPADFLCPITSQIFVDPVITTDGHTYERHAIEKWFELHNTSPMTNAHLSSTALIPNHTLRKAVEEFKEKNSQSSY